MLHSGPALLAVLGWELCICQGPPHPPARPPHPQPCSWTPESAPRHLWNLLLQALVASGGHLQRWGVLPWTLVGMSLVAWMWMWVLRTGCGCGCWGQQSLQALGPLGLLAGRGGRGEHWQRSLSGSSGCSWRAALGTPRVEGNCCVCKAAARVLLCCGLVTNILVLFQRQPEKPFKVPSSD